MRFKLADAKTTPRNVMDPAASFIVADMLADREARVAELSRMLAGVGGSTHARRHASELLAAARHGRSRS